MDDLNMKMGLIELYQLVGDNTGISFKYEGLPGVVVTIGFTLEEDELYENGNEDDGDEQEDDFGDEPDDVGSGGAGSSFH